MTTMKKEESAAQTIESCNKRLLALKKHVKAKTTIKVNGQSIKAASLIAIYQAVLDTSAAVSTKRAETKAALADRDKANATRIAAEVNLASWVKTEFGADSPAAHEFGFPPKKKGVRSVKANHAAVEKSLATRAARHTMGKKQRQQIKGTILVPTAPAVPVIHAQPTPPSVGATAPVNVASNGAPSPVLNGAAPH